jgi:hypothetical protein
LASLARTSSAPTHCYAVARKPTSRAIAPWPHTEMLALSSVGVHGWRGAALAATARDVTPRHRGGAALAHLASAVITPPASPVGSILVVRRPSGIRITPRLSCGAGARRRASARWPRPPLRYQRGRLEAPSAPSACCAAFVPHRFRGATSTRSTTPWTKRNFASFDTTGVSPHGMTPSSSVRQPQSRARS